MASSIGQSPDSLASEGHGAVSNSPLLLSGSEDAESPPKLVSERALGFSSQIPLKASDSKDVSATSGEAVFNQLLHRVALNKLNDSAISSCSEEGGGVDDGEDQFSVSPVSSVCGSEDDEAVPMKDKEKKEKDREREKDKVNGISRTKGPMGSSSVLAGRQGPPQGRYMRPKLLVGLHFEVLSKPSSFSKLARPSVRNPSPRVCPTGSAAPYRYRRRMMPSSISSETPQSAPFQWLPSGETRWSLVPLKWGPGPIRAWTKRQVKAGGVSEIKVHANVLKEINASVSVVRSHETITLREVEYQFCAINTRAKCRGNMNATDRKIKSLMALMETSAEVLYTQGMEIRRLIKKCANLELEQDIAAKLNESSLLGSSERNAATQDDGVGDSYFNQYTSKRLSPTDALSGFPGSIQKSKETVVTQAAASRMKSISPLLNGHAQSPSPTTIDSVPNPDALLKKLQEYGLNDGEDTAQDVGPATSENEDFHRPVKQKAGRLLCAFCDAKDSLTLVADRFPEDHYKCTKCSSKLYRPWNDVYSAQNMSTHGCTNCRTHAKSTKGHVWKVSCLVCERVFVGGSCYCTRCKRVNRHTRADDGVTTVV